MTFTNKATQEMKTRIVEFLYQLANGRNEPLRQELERRTALVGPALTERAQQVLRPTVARLLLFCGDDHRRVLPEGGAGFRPREMNLQAGFSIEIDEGKVLEEVIDELLLTLGDDRQKSPCASGSPASPKKR